ISIVIRSNNYAWPITIRFGGTVPNTLAKLQKGNRSDYLLIKHQLSDPDIKDAQIISWLGEIRTCVSQLGKDHEQLIYVVLVSETQMLNKSHQVKPVSEWSSLILHQVRYIMVITFFFLPERIRIQEGNVDISDSDDEDKNLPRTFDQCHQALQLIATYVPSTSRFLMPILSDKFPFVQKSSRTLECCVHNLLRVSMLTLAPWSEIEEMERGAQQDADGTSQDDCLFDMVSPNTSENNKKPNAYNAVHTQSAFKCTGSLDIEKTKAHYRDLLSVFDKVVLPTHASCHVHVLPGLAEVFLEHLWKMLQAHNQPPILRQAAAGYMDSFMARAKFLPVSTVKACLDLLAPWLHLYIDSQDSGSKAFCDVSLHSPFYTACQAVFYTLLFKNSAILEGNMKKGLAYLQGLNLERIVMCQLNLLRVCLTWQFHPSVGRKYQLVFCYTIIEQNNRNLLPVVSCSTLSTNTNPLDTFFPFDLYLLKSSGKLIEPIYQAWEEPSDCVIDVPKKEMRKVMYILMGMTPGSYDSHLHSPRSFGSPPVSFLQWPF
uniref:RRN3 homolog, RNA polymerase I transcription factor n=1 Tax=Cyprinus carpio carpio TaxID=630221 RepID=A0A9J8DIM5_CYPCA